MVIYLFQLVISYNHVKLPEGNHPKWDRMGMFVNMNQSYSGWYFLGEVFTMVLTYEKSMDSPRKNGWNWLDLMGISPIRPLIPGCTWQVRKCLDPMSTTSSCQRLEKKLRHKDGHVAMGF